MKGKKGVVDLLNKILTEELTVINQYFLHARMCENWGFERLEQKVKERSFGEMKDADEIIRHILFLEGLPNVQKLGRVTIGETVPEQLKLDLQKEKDMVKLLTEGIEHCVKVGDYNTRQKLEEMVGDEEEHIDWIETQLESIKIVGLQNYLSEQMKKES